LVFLRLKNSKSGISTVIGGVIVIAIIFTVIIPLFFYMNTITNLYDTITAEMRDFDQQRNWEDVDVFAWIPEGAPSEVFLALTNKGSIAVNIARIWVVPDIGEPEYDWGVGGGWEENMLLKPGEAKDINNLDINAKIDSLAPTTSYHFKIITARGNLFFSSPLFETPGDGLGVIEEIDEWLDPYPHAEFLDTIEGVRLGTGVYIIKVEIVGGTDEPYNYIVGASYFYDW
jgi:hypothetical protein